VRDEQRRAALGELQKLVEDRVFGRGIQG